MAAVCFYETAGGVKIKLVLMLMLFLPFPY